MYARCDAMLIFYHANFTCNIRIILQQQVRPLENTLSAVLAFVTVYAYMTHTRGVVLIIAVIYDCSFNFCSLQTQNS